jgi:hypothetical protein
MSGSRILVNTSLISDVTPLKEGGCRVWQPFVVDEEQAHIEVQESIEEIDRLLRG